MMLGGIGGYWGVLGGIMVVSGYYDVSEVLGVIGRCRKILLGIGVLVGIGVLRDIGVLGGIMVVGR